MVVDVLLAWRGHYGKDTHNERRIHDRIDDRIDRERRARVLAEARRRAGIARKARKSLGDRVVKVRP